MKSKFVRNLLFVLLVSIAVFTFLPTLFPTIWWIYLMSHFRVLYLVVLILIFAGFVIFQRKGMPLIIIVFLFIWNAKYIAPLYISPDEILKDPND